MQTQLKTYSPTFNKRFFRDYVGNMINNPEIAIVELVANCWDAGALKVYIEWPDNEGYFSIKDNGVGMSKKEFIDIWREVSYNRVASMQTDDVIFPNSQKIKRKAYGRNGKGRHSLFCFSDKYKVETWKQGSFSIFEVKKNQGKNAAGDPFQIEFIKEGKKEGNGTIISCHLDKKYISEDNLKKLLGSKFITDTNFSIYVNNNKIELVDLEDIIDDSINCYIEGEDEPVQIIRIASKRAGRISGHHGVAWWVNNRKVKENSWEGLDGAYLDRRTETAKKYTFIVFADILRDYVKPDWECYYR